MPNEIDAILMDMKMPEMDGYTCTKIIKDNPQLNHIPVIAVTASAMKESEEEIRSLCDSFIRKPFTRSELFSELAKYISHSYSKQEITEPDDSELKLSIKQVEALNEHIAELFAMTKVGIQVLLI